MSRGIGELSPIQELLPQWLAPILAVLTQLGDLWFLGTVLIVLYWTRVDKQDEVILVGGLFVAGIGLYRSLKYLFELPRPNQPLLDAELLPAVVRPLYEATAFASSYGFPSGHATTATIVYFGLATILTAGTRKRRYVVAGLTVVIVSFTRIALGLHFLVDVVVGSALGGVFLFTSFWVIERIPTDRATIILAIAAILNGAYLFASEFHYEAVIVFGAALGLFGGWQCIILAREIAAVDRPSDALRPVTARVVLALGAFAPLVVALDEFSIFAGHPYPYGGLAGIAAAIVVIVPIARYSPHAQRAFTAVRFWAKTIIAAIPLLLRPSTWRRGVDGCRQLWQKIK